MTKTIITFNLAPYSKDFNEQITEHYNGNIQFVKFNLFLYSALASNALNKPLKKTLWQPYRTS